MTKAQAVAKVMADYPAMTKAVATYYCEEVLGWS